ncbi:unnamed protein product [Spirodela intermedia]|uniref:Uncharacterized protein n=1 Tax=Spirodela intermedia TaxID=51605 RepID=A0A7I8L392_SPIIN|nr:unnamed protein product [Spirodela intermedia]
MAAVRKLFCVLVVFLLLSLTVLAEESSTVAGGVNCGFACARRCSKTSRRNMCLRSCGGCCRKCQCVPPGTAGNKEFCPCYASIRTRDGLRPKCP